MFVSIGEALIDRIHTDSGTDINRVGGGPLNTALALAHFGDSSAFFGSVSGDEDGKKILEYFIDNFIIFDPQLCGSCKKSMISEVSITKTSAQYNFIYEDTSVFDISSEKILNAMKVHSEIDAIVSGSVFITDDKSRSVLSEVVNVYSDKLFYLDLNIRENVISDMKSYLSKISPLIEKANFVHASSEDLTKLNVKPDLFSKSYPCVLLYTDGDRLSSWYESGKLICSRSVPKFAEFADSVGCGDIFNGAVLHYLKMKRMFHGRLEKEEISELLSLANTAASLNTLKTGIAVPDWDEVINAEKKISI